MKKTKTKILTVLVLILLAGIYYYVKLPAINIHADGFWMFLLVVIAAVAVFYIGRRRLFRKEDIKASGSQKADWAISSGSSGISGRDVVVLPDYQCQEVPEAS